MCIITRAIRCERSTVDELSRINENQNRVIYIFEKETHVIVCPIAGKLDWNTYRYWAMHEYAVNESQVSDAETRFFDTRIFIFIIVETYVG